MIRLVLVFAHTHRHTHLCVCAHKTGYLILPTIYLCLYMCKSLQLGLVFDKGA